MKTFDLESPSRETDYEDFMVIECGGCKTISFLHRMTTEHARHGETFLFDENFPKHSDRFLEYNF
jgi:hypothetical protein